MNTVRTVVLMSLVAFCISPGQTFEGTITFAISSPRGTQAMTYHTKGDQVRIDMERAPGMTMSVLMNTTSKDVTMLMPQNKMYMQMNLNTMPVPPDMNDQDADFKKTGKKETILGYVCEQVVISQENREVEMWVTKGLGKFVQANLNPRAQSPLMKKLEKELTDQGYFPLRTIARAADGSEEMKMEATSIDKKPLDDNLFVIPADYQLMQMPPPPQR